MTKQFLPSKYGHTLDDVEFTAMLEPMPGTQLIYEHLSNCTGDVKKVYPPNTTLVVHNTCKEFSHTVLGEVAKLVVERNEGTLYLGREEELVHTSEVVIKENARTIVICNSTDRVEIQTNSGSFVNNGTILEHVDVKLAGGSLFFR